MRYCNILMTVIMVAMFTGCGKVTKPPANPVENLTGSVNAIAMNNEQIMQQATAIASETKEPDTKVRAETIKTSSYNIKTAVKDTDKATKQIVEKINRTEKALEQANSEQQRQTLNDLRWASRASLLGVLAGIGVFFTLGGKKWLLLSGISLVCWSVVAVLTRHLSLIIIITGWTIALGVAALVLWFFLQKRDLVFKTVTDGYQLLKTKLKATNYDYDDVKQEVKAMQASNGTDKVVAKYLSEKYQE